MPGLEFGDVRNGLELLEEHREAFAAQRVAAVDDHVSVVVRMDVTVLVLLPCHLPPSHQRILLPL